MPGASYWLEWIDDPRYYAPTFDAQNNLLADSHKADGNIKADKSSKKGAWLLVNTTENVYEYARNAGNFREEKWGDVHEEYVGSENPPTHGGKEVAFATTDDAGTKGHEPPHTIAGLNYDLPHKKPTGDSPPTYNNWRATPQWAEDNKGMVRSNPHIIEKTWARRIDSWTGSSGWRIPSINEETWAVEKSEITDISGGITSVTRIGRGIAETTSVGAGIASNLNVIGGMAENVNVGGAKVEIVDTGVLSLGLTHSIGPIVEEKLAILGHYQFDFSSLHFTFELSGIIEILIAAKLSIELGASYTVQRGKHEEWKSKKQKNALKDYKNAVTTGVYAMNTNFNQVDVDLDAINAKVNALAVHLGVG
jgi:hypothetical protein